MNHWAPRQPVMAIAMYLLAYLPPDMPLRSAIKAAEQPVAVVLIPAGLSVRLSARRSELRDMWCRCLQ
jgi:hypothetical protein